MQHRDQVKRTMVWNLSGFLAAVFIVHFWILLFDPFKTNWHYPGEATGFSIGALVSLVFSVAAGVKASHYWYAATVALLVTILLVMARMH